MKRAAARLILAAAACALASAQAPVPAPEGPPPARLSGTMQPAPVLPPEFLLGKAEFEKGNFNGAYLSLLPFAHRGNAEAQYLLGRMSDEGGGGIALDPREAIRWYKDSATKDFPKALYALAKAAAVGRGMPQAPEQALEYLTRAAEGDFSPAMLDMASLYDDGRGVEPDRAKAFDWYRRAADLGSTEARFVVGERLYKGDGVAEDRDEARRWYQLAAGRGHPGALFRLAQIGYGTQMNADRRIQTYTWLTLAQQRGGPEIRKEATDLRTKLGNTMLQVDIDAATQRARAWKPEPPLKGEPVDPEDPYNDPAKMKAGR
ncbi:MAG: sel1 repeat family protein [Proteobacteria bacterium]|nr:sel1 repeat family protein [Pseudomonadota bacterium]